MAASLYKVFGMHEIFGRLLTLAFRLATVVTLAYFARWLFSSPLAGILAACFYAVFPGSVYYGRTFTPDGAMVFFLTAALYASARFLLDDETLAPRPLARTAALVTLAYLAKPVAVMGILPIGVVAWQRLRAGRPTRATAIAVLLAVPLLILWLYDRRVASYAQWHWASGIVALHVWPGLRDSFAGAAGFTAKLAAFRTALGMLRQTMLGSVGFVCSVAAFGALPWIAVRSRPLLWAWLIAALAYVYVVVTVERVDYYMYPLLPLCALVIGGAAAAAASAARTATESQIARVALYAAIAGLALAVLFEGRAAVAPYYAYDARVYRNATSLDATLDKGALVVIGHYGPDVQYYIDRFGWEEDPAIWTPFDEESAIAKGARYFISIEDNRLRRNLELCAWLQRFPVRNPSAAWIVYETDPRKTLPGADAFWRSFRRAERAGNGRAFLDRTALCSVRPLQRPMPSNSRKSAANASG